MRSGTRTKKAKRKRPHGEAKEAKPKAWRATNAELLAINKLVPSLIQAAVDGNSALPVVGVASKENWHERDARCSPSLNSSPKWRRRQGRCRQRLTQWLAKASCWTVGSSPRRDSDLISIIALLNDKALAPVLKDEHAEQISSEGGARALALQVQQMLITLETNCQ